MLFVIGVVVVGPVKPEAIVVQDTGGLNEAVVCNEKVGSAAPVHVKVRSFPVLVVEVIKISGAKAKVVIAWPKVPSFNTPTNVVLPVVRSIVTNSRAKTSSVFLIP